MKTQKHILKFVAALIATLIVTLGCAISLIQWPYGPTPTPIPPLVANLLEEIDKTLKESISSNIVYNEPKEMNLGDTTTIELLMNPSKSAEELTMEMTETGTVISSSIEITPRMSVILFADDPDAFVVRPIQDSSEQLISSKETTKWNWFITAKKSGLQRLTLVIFRLVKFQDQDFWREVETYKIEINVNVTLTNQVEKLDWKWAVGIIITALLIPGFWRWYDQQKKQARQKAKPKSSKKD